MEKIDYPLDETPAVSAEDGGYVSGDYTPTRVDPGPEPAPTPAPLTVENYWPWLTPQLRKAIQGMMASLGVVLSLTGLVSVEKWQSIADASDALIGLMIICSSMISILHIPRANN